MEEIEAFPGVMLSLRRPGDRAPIAFGGLAPGGVIGALYVDPEWRRQGVGRRMVAALERLAGAVRVSAHVHAENRASRALFESLGYWVDRTFDFAGEPFVAYVKEGCSWQR